MSYAEKIGDKFYWMNPPDAREGDECRHPTGWFHCYKWQVRTTDCYKFGYERRRLIAPGEGWRILGVEEQLPIESISALETTIDGYKWFVCDDAWKGQQVGQAILGWGDKVVAIRQRIPVEAGHNYNMMPTPDPRIQAVIDAARAFVDRLNFYNSDSCITERRVLESALAALMETTKDDEWPRYWFNINSIWKAESLTDGGSIWHFVEQKWKPYIAASASLADWAKRFDWKRLTPAEAQARMEGKQEPNYPPTLCCHYQSIVRKDYPVFWNPGNGVVQCHNCGAIYSPAQDELQVLWERVKETAKTADKSISPYDAGCYDQCLEIQRWIEDAIQKRNEVPAQVVGEELKQKIRQEASVIDTLQDHERRLKQLEGKEKE